MPRQYRVGELRPSQILFSFGIGATVDLAYLSVMVMGLDRWRLERAEEIPEARLLQAVQRQLGGQVERLYAPPALPTEPLRSPLDEAARVGIPVSVFPRWLRCPRCDQIAPVDSGLFELKDPHRQDCVRYVHVNCSKMKGHRAPAAVPVRFIVACENGHMDDFPWVEYVHGGNTHCTGLLRLYQFGVSDAVADVLVECDQCQARRRLVEAFGREAGAILPKCRGHHPHLGPHHVSECRTRDDANRLRPTALKTLLLGASNGWFPILSSVLSVPAATGNRLAQLVEDHWPVLQAATSRAVLAAFRQIGQLKAFAEVSDDALWEAILARRSLEAPEDQPEADLKRPEWEAFTQPDPQRDNEDFQLETAPLPPGYERYFARIVLAPRLREVRALTGFTRIESPGEFGEEWAVPPERRAPLATGKPTWVPSVEVRGEGIFIQFQEAVLAAWCRLPAVQQREQAFREAHWQWRHARGITPESEGFPGLRYLLLHSFAHALMRQVVLECGYASASVRERIYARGPDEPGGPTAGVLLYTAAADSEGTLGGLVAQGRPLTLAGHLSRALEQMRLCTSDPLCAGHHPHREGVTLHGAACHACLFAPETACERGNKYLDRTLLVETLNAAQPAFFLAVRAT